MKLKKRLTNNVGLDPTVATLLATGMAGLAVVVRDEASPDEQSEQAATQAPQDAPALDPIPFTDPVLPPPPPHEPGQRSVFHQQEAEHLLIADLLPPVETALPIDWQTTPPTASEPVAAVPQPTPSQAPQMADTPPPPQPDNEEDMSEEEDDVMMETGQDAGDDIAAPSGQDSPDGMVFEPPTLQEEALWECLFDDVNVPQNEIAPPFEVPLNRDVTEARLLLEISFGDPVLDAGGFVLRAPNWVPLEEELVTIQNGNEAWLVADFDLNDHSYLSNLPLSIISLADPTMFRILDIYVGPPGDTTFEDTFFTHDASEENEGEGEGEDEGEYLEIPLNRDITTARQLAEISFDDAHLDAGGISLDVRGAQEYGAQLFGVENGNEIWLRPDIDLNDLFFTSYIEIHASANLDPHVTQTIAIQIGPTGDGTFEDTYFAESESSAESSAEPSAEPNAEPSGGMAASPDGTSMAPCAEVIEDYVASEPMEDFSSSAPDIL